MKRLICVILTMAMLLSLIPVQTLALADLEADPEDVGPASSVTDDDGFTYVYDLPSGGYKLTGYSGMEDEVVVPGSVNGYPVTVIGSNAFMSGYIPIRSVTLPDTVKVIEEYAFGPCYELESVYLGNSLETIGDYAFEGTCLRSVTLPDTLRSIGDGAFNCCYDLEELVIPAGVTHIGIGAFPDNSSLQLSVAEGNTCYQYTQNCLIDLQTKTLILCRGPFENLDGMVEVIGPNAFERYSTDILIVPDGVTTISERAFAYLDATTVVLPDTLKTIKNSAFFCAYVESVDLGSSVETIEANAFSHTQLTAVQIPASVTSLASGAFSSCEYLSSVVVDSANPAYVSKNNCVIETATGTLVQGSTAGVIPDDGSVKAIGESAFEGIYAGIDLVIPGTVETIGDWAFAFCDNYTTLTLCDGVKTVGARAFAQCDSLTSVNMADSVTYIGDSSFYWNESLCDVTLSAGLKEIGANAFNDCDKLIEFVIPDSVTAIGKQVFFSCNYLRKVTIGSRVTAIGDGAFWYCGALTDVYYTGGNWEAIEIGENNEDLVNASLHQVGGHNYTGTVTTEPGCTTPGVMTYTCSHCDSSYTEGIPAVGHSYTAGVCTTCGGYVQQTVCFKNTAGWETVYAYAFRFTDDGQYQVFTQVWPGTEMTLAERDIYSVSIPMIAEAIIFTNGTDQTEELSFPDDYRRNVYVYSTGEWAVKEELVDYYLVGYINGADYGVGPDQANLGEYKFVDGKLTATFTWTSDVYIKTHEGKYYMTYGHYRDTETCVSLQESEPWMMGAGTMNVPSHVVLTFTLAVNTDGTLTLSYTEATCSHDYGDWITETQPGCVTGGKRYKVCGLCGDKQYETLPSTGHSYKTEVIAPTYFVQGYTLHTCSVCGYSYQDEYVNALDRIALSNATLTLEYTFAYYQGKPLTPSVSLTYGGITVTDVSEELKITYSGNDRVGTATVLVEGINMFEGSAELTFEIAYETLPEQIYGLVAIGEIGQISLSWGKSSEVTTDSYKLYRKGEGESDFRLIAELKGRETISYVDTAVVKGQSYAYYVTGVGLYGAESQPSQSASAQVLIDVAKPVVHKITPTAASVIFGTVTLSATATDNVAVTKIHYAYSVDNGASWVTIGEGFAVSFHVAGLAGESVKVRAIAYDAEGNESEPMIVAYSLDNVGPDAPTGLSAVALTSKITLSWKDVAAKDAAYFTVQMLQGEQWITVASRVTTLGYHATGLAAQTEYTFRVACVDTHNNVGAYSEPITVTTLADTVAPVITAQGPAAGKYRDGLTYWATAKDECGVEKMTIQISLDNMATWTDLTGFEYMEILTSRQCSAYVNLSGYPEGSVYLRAIAVDAAGNVSSTGDLAPYSQYIIDRTAPNAPVGVSAAGATGYIEVRWSAGADSDLRGFDLYRSETEDGEYTLLASGLTSLNYFDRNVESGKTYYYKLTVSDSCGNVSDLSQPVWAAMQDDTVKPSILGFTQIYGGKISPMYHTITVNASDNNQLKRIVVEYCTAAAPQYVLMADSPVTGHNGSVSVTLPMDRLSDGDTVYLRAYAVDGAGFVSDYATARYTVDRTAPDVEHYTATIDGSTVTVNWNSCTEEDLAGYKLYRSDDGVHFRMIASMAAGRDTYSYCDEITAVESGAYVYRLEALDRVGNSNLWQETVEYTYVYVNKAPVAVLDAPETMSVGVEEQFSAAGSYDDISIVSWLWEFGDGTTSTEPRPVKLYENVGTYTVTLTVTDNEGVTATATATVEVKAREEFGNLNVTVFNERGNALPNFPVYFDLGEKNMQIVYTNASGRASVKLVSGMHTVGAYADGYLPAKKDVVVLGNASRNVTLTTVEQQIVTGEFEVTRMTFDEIVAAGIDVYDPANQNVYSGTVRITYNTTSYDIRFAHNSNNVLYFDVSSSGGGGKGTNWEDFGDSNHDTGRTFFPRVINEKTVAILDVPASASYLKEFFDVRLHIINHAGAEFALEQNEVTLNVPDGMTLMTGLSGGYQSSAEVKFDSLAGQQTMTLAWVLRGDKAGEYDLSADYTGVLAQFNEIVSTQFVTREPIKVYGLEGVKFRILVADEIHNDTLYFNVEFENQRPIDVYLPKINANQWITNVTDAYRADTFMLNSYIQTGDGEKLYNPVFVDAAGNVIADELQVLAPGQKVVHEYVAYNAIDYNGVAGLEELALTSFSGIFENIEVGSFHKDRYSFKDYGEKLDRLLYPSEKEVADAFNYVSNDNNYYYIAEAEGASKLAHTTYGIFAFLLSGDTELFTDAKQEDVARQAILRMLSDASTTEIVEDSVMNSYLDTTQEILNTVKTGLLKKFANDVVSTHDIAVAFINLSDDAAELAVIYRSEGSAAFRAELSRRLAGYAFGAGLDLLDYLSVDAESEIFSKCFGAAKDLVCNFMKAVDQAERDMYYYSFLKMNCNFEISNQLLDAIIAGEADKNSQQQENLKEFCRSYVIIRDNPTSEVPELQRAERTAWLVANNNVTYQDMETILADEDMTAEEMYALLEDNLSTSVIGRVARELKTQLNSNKEEYFNQMELVFEYMVKGAAEELIKSAVTKLLQKAIGSTLLTVISTAFNLADVVFGFGKVVEQERALQIYADLTETVKSAFIEMSRSDDEDAPMYSMIYLRALCELRLGGEAQTAKFIQDRMKKVLLPPQDEQDILAEINSLQGKNYTSIDQWVDDVQYRLVHARDVMFNTEFATEVVTPDAPLVSLNYATMQTDQSFGAEYEYCFADGVWKQCQGAPISFKVGIVPGTLRVRVRATQTALAGKITTVKIFARRELSKLIDIKFNGSRYLVDGLSADYYYQIYFTNDSEAKVNWSYAATVAGSQKTVTVGGFGKYDYAIIRSCPNAEKQETTSAPLVVAVDQKHPLQLIIEGSGTVTQTSSLGQYYYGDTIDLVAEPMTGTTFEGWYINGECVSQDTVYVLEMAPEVELKAVFTGAKIEEVTISQLPHKLEYVQGEALDLTGLELLVTYDDGTSVTKQPDTAYFTSTSVGASQAVVGFGGCNTMYDVQILMDPVASMPEVELEFSAASLALVNDMIVRLNVDSMLFEQAGFVDPYVACEMNGYSFILDSYYLAHGNYVFTLEGINPARINDTFTITLFGYYNGRRYASEPKQYSVAQYCYNLLQTATGDENATLRRLVVDLLNYGAASQLYTGYHTHALANSALTPEQQLWGTSTTPTLSSVLDTAYTTIADPDAVWKSAGVDLTDTVALRFRFEIEDPEDVTVKLVGESGMEIVIAADQLVPAKSGSYYVIFDQLTVSQMSEILYVTVYRGQQAISNTLRYSIESYACAKQSTDNQALKALVIAMIKYGDAAKAYAQTHP